MARPHVLALGIVLLGGAAGASARDAPLLRSRYRLDGVDEKARPITGELLLDLDAMTATRATRSLGKRTVRRDGGVTLRTGELLVACAETRATYRSDGRGGLVGRSTGPEGELTEYLAPLIDDDALARVASARAPRELLALFRDARSDSLEALRAMVEEVHAQGRLYPALDALPEDDRRELAKLARAVAPPLPPSGEDDLEKVEGTFRYDAIIVPGMTLPYADRVHLSNDVQDRRCKMAAQDFHAGRAPYVIVTGGRAHPDGTPIIEAVEMKAELIRLGVPATRVVLEPAARHTTTNLRNAGRIMLRRGWKKALVVTTVGHAFYIGMPDYSSFGRRCKREFGYVPGRLTLIDANRATFVPSERCAEESPSDPFDP